MSIRVRKSGCVVLTAIVIVTVAVTVAVAVVVSIMDLMVRRRSDFR